MNDGTCAACGEPTIFEEELGSAICTSCGTLANPSQNILDSHLEHINSSGRDYNPQSIAVAGGSTLKGRNGHSLAGQDKEARDRRNTLAMHEFIKTIASRVSHPGSALRAQTIFDQAMSRGRFRWGRKAKRISGASLALALREARKNVSLREIAYLIEEPLVSLARSFSNICSLLQLKVDLFEPAQHLPPLESHLMTLIRTPKESPLPKALVTALTPLIPRLAAVRNTVTSLATLVARVDELANLPTAPSACALLILALEGELSASLPNAGALAQALGTRLGVSKAVVMQRYKAVYDLVEEYIKEVPWLDSHDRRPGKGRSKVAKRVVVAKGLKDVVQFQDEIWGAKFAGTENPVLMLETDTDEDDVISAEGSVCSAGTYASTASRSHSAPPYKKRKTRYDRHVAELSRSLLQPHIGTSGAGTSPSEASHDLFQHFLTADDSTLSHAFSHPPTRLQILANLRGGDHAIGDDELFDNGELEGFLRSPAEVDALRTTLNWDDVSPEDVGDTKHKKRKRSNEDAGEDATRTQRIDTDVLARLLDPSTTMGEDDFDPCTEKETEDGRSTLDGLSPLGRLVDGEEIIEEWRPMSPGGGGYDDDRYDI